MKKNNKYIKIFALMFFILINISSIANVNALTDDNGNEVKCIIQESGLNIQSNRDYCLTFDTEIKGEKYAKLCWYSSAYGKNICHYINKEYKYLFIDTSGNYRPTTNQSAFDSEYMIYIGANYYEAPSQVFKYNNYKILNDSASDYSNKSNILNVYTIILGRTQYESLNSDKILNKGYNSELGVSFQGLILKIKNGILDYSIGGITSGFLGPEISKNDIETRILKTNLDIYEFTNKNLNWYDKTSEDYKNIELIKDNSTKPRNITYTYEKVKNNELYNIEFSVKGLKQGDKIFLGNYDSDNEKYLQQFNIISNTENPSARFVFNDISKNAKIDILIKDEKDNILISESVNIDIDIFEDLKNGNINDFFNYVKNFINNKINKPIKNIMNSFQLLFNSLDADIQIGIVIIFLIVVLFTLFRFLI